jgi:hypothetical protein
MVSRKRRKRGEEMSRASQERERDRGRVNGRARWPRTKRRARGVVRERERGSEHRARRKKFARGATAIFSSTKVGVSFAFVKMNLLKYFCKTIT